MTAGSTLNYDLNEEIRFHREARHGSGKAFAGPASKGTVRWKAEQAEKLKKEGLEND